MSPQKRVATRRSGGPGASHENAERPAKSKPHGELSEPRVKSGNAREREQNKRTDRPNIDQQGERANVRQNTTRQGNRRSA
jgi:hypothetical protein